MILSTSHTCDGGNRTLKWSQFCDGIIDCHDHFDEEGHFCKPCINNIYSCSPNDDIRCDLACQMLNYVPCQTIQDRRACYSIQKNYDDMSMFELFEQYKFYILAIIIMILVFILITTIILIKYFIRRHRQSTVNSRITSSIEKDPFSSHIYEQCYEPPSYESLQNKHSLMTTYCEYSV